MSVPTEHQAAATAIRPFGVDVPDQALDDLRRRVEATRWPGMELVADASQGVQLATLQELARYWASEYDWRRCEAKLNALPQFTTEIDGLDVHFLHVTSPHADALPLLITHGWPGSVVELLEVVGPLTDPTAHGGRAEDAFHLVIPSLPGMGFSTPLSSTDWTLERSARAFDRLMRALGYESYGAHGSDGGAMLSREQVLAQVTLYWLTNTSATSTRYHYTEARSGAEPVVSQGRIGVAVFADDFKTIRAFAERDNANIQHWAEYPTGGHYAAMEVPDQLVTDIRTFFAQP